MSLNLIAVGYSLGLAASVLYLGALGDRYGRKMMLVLGTTLAIPMSLLAAFAPSDEVLFVARVGGGVAAGMAYPTTLALITALWSGPGRTRSIALWSALGGAIAALGPLAAGALLEEFDWGSVFLITLPLAAVALVLAYLFVPSHVNETSDPVDNLGGILSVVLVGALILSINFAPVPNEGALVFGLAAIALGRAHRLLHPAAAREESALRLERRRTPNVLGRRVRRDHRLRLAHGRGLHQPAVPAERARLLDARGGCVDPARGGDDGPRRAEVGQACRDTGRPIHAPLRLRLPPARVPHDARRLGRGSARTGRSPSPTSSSAIGVGLAGTPASHSLTGSVPVTRAGMASGTADLQRDLGGAILQSTFGALLTAGYASAMSAAIAASDQNVTDSTQAQLTKSFAGAEAVAGQHPAQATAIVSAAKTSFLEGDDWAYTAGAVAIVIGAVLVFFMFPKRDEEKELLARYHAEDTGGVLPPSAEQAAPKSPPASAET